MDNAVKIVETAIPKTVVRKNSFSQRASEDFKKNKSLYFLMTPVILFYLIFCYKPMYGALIAFQNYNPGNGMLASEWVGFKHFIDFFSGYYFLRVLSNTVIISLSGLVFGFPAPIILAFLMNELKNKYFCKTVQTITYLPHFISLVVICGMIKDFTADNGVINYIIRLFGGETSTMLSRPEMFVPVYIISDIWQGIGWGSIIYLAALSGIDPQLYEAARIDGAGHFKQAIHITLPGIIPTIVIMLILRIGNILNVGFEKIILLYSPLTYKTADVISTYVYRKGLGEYNWSFSAAVGLFNSVINFGLLLGANYLSRKMSESSLW